MRLYVLILLFSAIVLHVLGSFGLQLGDADAFAHYGMLAADVVAFVGLLAGYRLGHMFAVALFVYAVGSQTYWTIEAIVKNYDMAAAQGATAVLCGIALFFLVRYKERFVVRTYVRSRPRQELAENF